MTINLKGVFQLSYNYIVILVLEIYGELRVDFQIPDVVLVPFEAFLLEGEPHIIQIIFVIFHIELYASSESHFEKSVTLEGTITWES